MEMPGNTFDEVHPSKYELEFYLFIVRSWDSPAKQNLNETQTIEIVAEDSKGQRIHIQVPKGLAKRWRPHLKEFQMYRITNVVVVDPRMRKNIKTIPCKWYLAFSHRTNVQHVENPVFPINPFRFKTHTQLLDEDEVLPSHTFDFIGEVVGKEDPRDVVTSTGRETKRMVIVLQDTEGWLNPFTETHRKQMAKKNAATERKAAAKSMEKQIKAPAKTALKNQGHEFRCLPKTVAQMFIYINGEPEKRALVDDMGFGGLSYLPNEYLNQRLLKQIYDHYDLHDNTIYSDAAAVEITTNKIGHALGLSSRGTPYDTKVARNELSEEDKEVHDYFKGFTTVALQDLIKATPVDIEENKKLWMRAFILFVQKVFLFPNSTAKICAAALPTLFDLENTRHRNWAHHVHNFLLQELKKAKRKESAAIHGCCYVLMIIYFHETQFGENSRDPAAQPPWLAYWTGENLKKRIKQERQHDVGLLKTGQLRAEKEQLKKKSTKRVPSSDSESQTEPEPPYSNSTIGEGDSMSDSDETISEQRPQQKEIRSKRRFDHAVVGSNAPLNPTQ
ncbi:hypothetical protein PIB30_064262 [Stylosanthes scabra]|uniref:Replication protein A 70 kDa DNA-binding subunit B/D first OB fold domain-containing protein n=1 Tax=Stylosanthes scabra TaxID=79078 RepID=A0ABU6YJV5_9FABA|nr:hypothetical protein [Stylosanthes scabra]